MKAIVMRITAGTSWMAGRAPGRRHCRPPGRPWRGWCRVPTARHHRTMATEDDARRIALSLPATTERPSYGTPGFRVKDKLFARIHDLPDTLVVWVADMDEKEALLASSPDTLLRDAALRRLPDGARAARRPSRSTS